ncbi:MAG: glycoside hydrolase family 38 C-terminal domain-containing protein [Eubacteriales bacterium]|nr:glycoside hydrolase family 38 C-terminal domain-containing protein [Eubacteriales bacterium]
MANREGYPGRQWRERLDMWAKWFPEHYWEKAFPLTLTGFVTKERLSGSEAAERVKGPEAKEFRPGMSWGSFWEYGWFWTELTVPAELAGERLIFAPGIGEEMLVWVNGRESGAVDKKHSYVTLTRKAKAGEHFTILMECYAGHGPRMEGGSLCRPGEEPFSLEDGPQQTVRESFAGVWQETVFQVGMDYLTLYSLRKRLPERSLRAMRVTEGLKRFIERADLEVAREKIGEVLLRADEELKPLLACVNGSTAPEFTVFGQSHLDLSWLWTAEETRRKAARTYGNQLALLEEYPEYRFLLCEPPILEYLKESYPALWERVKEKVKSGQIYADGALYVEGDMNMPCGESLARQFLYGKEWFREELGTDSRVAWMPDTFGFPGSLPQIMKLCSVPYFSTQKLIRQDPECDPFPYNTFWWEGIDGSRVLADTYKENNAVPLPDKMIERWEDDRIQEEGIGGMMYPFGYGDGGGGATRQEVEELRRCADLEGAPRTVYESPEAYFKKVEVAGTDNVFTGELYLAWHRGTYTAQAKTKLGVRRAECALKEAEYWNAVCAVLAGWDAAQDAAALKALWKRLLFQEFHDILPGTGIARVHEEAERELDSIAREAEEILRGCLDWLEKAESAESDKSGQKPAGEADAPASVLRGRTPEGGYFLESPVLYAELDSAGRVRRLEEKCAGKIRKAFGAEGQPMNELRLYRNVNSYYDAWEIGRMYQQEEEVIDRSDWRLEEGSYEGRAAWKLTGKIGNSAFTQYICLGTDGGQVEFYTVMDWRERHRMLKADFPTAVHSARVIGEIAFGAAGRPTTRSRQWEKDMYEVCSHRYSVLENGREGLAVMNDSKYGWSAQEDRISLTLLRAPLMPDLSADQGRQEFAYAVRPYEGSFGEANIPRRAVLFDRSRHLEDGLLRRTAALNRSFCPFWLEAAPWPGETGDSCHVLTEAVKLAEDGSNRLVLRLYEAAGAPQRVILHTTFPVREAVETDLLEQGGTALLPEDVPQAAGAYRLEFRAFEIKTVIIAAK